MKTDTSARTVIARHPLVKHIRRGHYELASDAPPKSRRRARLYLLGLLSGAERKNSWTIAEQAGELTPDGMQRLLNFYRWDAEAVCDDLRSYVLEQLGDPACPARTPVPVTELVRVAGSRWAVEETFQFAKNETVLDH